MQIINDLVRNIQMIAAAVIIILLLFGGIGVYLFRTRKTAAAEKEVDYSEFRRKDVMEYVKLDDVAEDMLVSDNGRRFFVRRCRGRGKTPDDPGLCDIF